MFAGFLCSTQIGGTILVPDETEPGWLMKVMHGNTPRHGVEGRSVRLVVRWVLGEVKKDGSARARVRVIDIEPRTIVTVEDPS